MSTNGKPKASSARVLKDLRPQCLADEFLRKQFPTLFDLFVQQWKDGICTRQAGSLTIKPDGAIYKLTFTCPTEGVQTILYVESLKDVLEVVESRVADGKCPWTMTYAKAKRTLAKQDD